MESNNKRTIGFFEKLLKTIYPHGLKDESILIIKNAIPLTLSTLSQALLTMMSLFFCGHLGPDELAAVSLANPFIQIFGFAPILGLSSACDTLFPQLYGGVNKKSVGIMMQKGFLISILAAFPCAGILLNSKNLMILFVKEKIVVLLAFEYLQYFIPTIFFYSIQIILSKYLQSQNIFYPILFINVTVNIINAILQALFVFWANIGVKGAAISIVISNVVQVVLLFLYTWKKKLHKETWPDKLGWSIECLYNWKLYLKLGIAGFGMIVFEWANFEVAVICAGILGSIDLSVMSICLQVLFIFFMVPFGIGFSGNIRVGQLLGENSPDRAFNSIKVVITVSTIISLTLTILLLSLSSTLPLIFTNHVEIIRISSDTLKILSFVSFLDGLQICSCGLIRSVGAQKLGVIVSFVAYYLIGMPLGIYLLLKTKFRVLGYWMGFCFAAIIIFTIQTAFIFRIDWIKTAEKAHNRSKIDKEKQKAMTNVDEKAKNLKRKIFKKVILYFVFISSFIISCFTRNLNQFGLEHEILKLNNFTLNSTLNK